MSFRKMDIRQLFSNMEKCQRCDLFRNRIKAVLPEGDFKARIMMIAQSPGEQENKQGLMFIGPSGKIFNSLLEEAGVRRNQFYLTNLIKCMLPKSRRPSRSQWEACTPWLEEEIRLVRPEIFVPLGFQATKFLLIRFGLIRPPKKEYRFLFGRFLPAGDQLIYPLRHPTALLFDPDKREIMIENYKRLKGLVEKER